MVDVEALVVNALLDDAGVAALVSDRVYTDLPAQPRWPLVVVTRIGGLTDPLGHIDSALVQVEGWAKDRETAFDVTADALSALLAIRGVFTEGVVTGAAPFTGIGYLPDAPSTTPRYVFRLTLYAHPNPATV